MKTFKMIDGDYVLDNTNNLVIISGTNEVRQSIERILTTNITEWFLNVDFGLDYAAIQGKGKTNADIEIALRQAIFQDNRITDIEFKEIVLKRDTRHLTVILDVVVENEVIEGIEVSL